MYICFNEYIDWVGKFRHVIFRYYRGRTDLIYGCGGDVCTLSINSGTKGWHFQLLAFTTIDLINLCGSHPTPIPLAPPLLVPQVKLSKY